MAASWTPDERDAVEHAILQHPVTSGRCAAVARVVFDVGQRRDEETRGRQVRPRAPAGWMIVKHSGVRVWASHTFVEAHRHVVDALTGVDGYDPARYLDRYFEHVSDLEVIDVDVHQVDPGIEVDL